MNSNHKSDLSKLSVLRNGPMYICHAFVSIEGKFERQTWLNSVSAGALMRSVCMEYAQRPNTVVQALFMCEVAPVGNMFSVRVSGKLLRGANDDVMLFSSPGAAEVYAENQCRV